MSSYNRPGDLGRRLAEIERRLRETEGAPRLHNASLQDGGGVNVYDTEGNLSARYGEQWDATYGAVSLNGPTPPTPVTPTVTGTIGGINVAWSGAFVGGAITPMDYAWVEIYVSTTEGFTVHPNNLVGTIVSSQSGEQFVATLDTATRYVKLVTRTQSGKFSPPSLEASGTPSTVEAGEVTPPVAPDIDNVTGAWSYNDFFVPTAQFTVTWDPVATDTSGNPTIVSAYEVWMKAGAADWVLAGSTANTTLVLKNQSFGVSYSFKVRAVSQVPSAFSSTLSQTVSSGVVTEVIPLPKALQVTSRMGIVEAKYLAQTSTNTTVPDHIARAEIGAKATSGGVYAVVDTVMSPNAERYAAITNVGLPGSQVYTAVRFITRGGSVGAWNATTTNPTIVVGVSDDDLADTTISDQITEVQETADSKNSVTYSAAAPTVSDVGTATGDIWFQRTGGVIIGQWEWTGSAWAAVTLGNSVIANLDAGKITSGYINADQIEANSITVDKLVIGNVPGLNLVPNPGFEMGEEHWANFNSPPPAGITRYINTSGGSWSHTGQNSFYTRKSTSGGYVLTGPSSKNWIFIQPATTYDFTIWMKRLAGDPTPAETDYVFMTVLWDIPGGGTVTTVEPSTRLYVDEVPLGSWVPFSVTLVPPVGAVSFKFTMNTQISFSAGFLYDDAEVYTPAPAAIIGDGSITTPKLAAGAVTADKLESDIILSSIIYAGPPTGAHAEMTEEGFKVFKADGSGATEILRAGMGSVGSSVGLQLLAGGEIRVDDGGAIRASYPDNQPAVYFGSLNSTYSDDVVKPGHGLLVKMPTDSNPATPDQLFSAVYNTDGTSYIALGFQNRPATRVDINGKDFVELVATQGDMRAYAYGGNAHVISYSGGSAMLRSIEGAAFLQGGTTATITSTTSTNITAQTYFSFNAGTNGNLISAGQMLVRSNVASGSAGVYLETVSGNTIVRAGGFNEFNAPEHRFYAGSSDPRTMIMSVDGGGVRVPTTPTQTYHAASKWYVDSLQPSDSGWINMSANLNPGYTGAIMCRKLGNVVYVRGDVSGSFPNDSSATFAAAIPWYIGWEVTATSAFHAWIEGNYDGTIIHLSTGTLSLRHRVGSAVGRCVFAYNYMTAS